MTGEAVQVVHDEAAHQYHGVVDGERLARLDYAERDGVLRLVHTEVDPRARGRGIGESLVRSVLDELRAAGTRIVPSCPFVSKFIDGNPEYRDLVR